MGGVLKIKICKKMKKLNTENRNSKSSAYNSSKDWWKNAAKYCSESASQVICYAYEKLADFVGFTETKEKGDNRYQESKRLIMIPVTAKTEDEVLMRIKEIKGNSSSIRTEIYNSPKTVSRTALEVYTTLALTALYPIKPLISKGLDVVRYGYEKLADFVGFVE